MVPTVFQSPGQKRLCDYVPGHRERRSKNQNEPNNAAEKGIFLPAFRNLRRVLCVLMPEQGLYFG